MQLEKGQIYAVKIYNNSQRDVAVSLSIDGIDEFQFSQDRIKDGPDKGRPKYKHFVVSPPSRGKPTPPAIRSRATAH